MSLTDWAARNKPGAEEPAVAPEFTQYRRTQIAEMADFQHGMDMRGVSISEADRKAGSPRLGDKIARNPANHDDKWLVAAAYFAANFESTNGLSSETNTRLEQENAAFEQENAALRTRAEDAERGWHDLLAKQGRPEQRNAQDVLVSLANLAEEQLGQLKHLVARAAGGESEDRTSVKIETGAKRELKATIHVYAGDTDQAANNWLVEEAIRLHGLAQAYCDEGST